jgi:hypothetical protein
LPTFYLYQWQGEWERWCGLLHLEFRSGAYKARRMTHPKYTTQRNTQLPLPTPFHRPLQPSSKLGQCLPTLTTPPQAQSLTHLLLKAPTLDTRVRLLTMPRPFLWCTKDNRLSFLIVLNMEEKMPLATTTLRPVNSQLKKSCIRFVEYLATFRGRHSLSPS